MCKLTLKQIKKIYGNKASLFNYLAIGDIFCFNLDSIKRNATSNFKIKTSETNYSYADKGISEHTIEDDWNLVYRVKKG